MTTLVKGIDLDLLLEDLAYSKRRITELEDNQETILKFLQVRFPKHAGKLKGLLRENGIPKRDVKPTTAFNQEDIGTTERAIINCFSAKSVSVDPLDIQVGFISSKKTPELSDSLRG